ncbi:MAG: PEP-CTERM sorting domain-containing protein [Phycisphaerae bacterium]|nr:PEP-CTERM sorting domain-containing protein [Tepidisphaeraceae bacterium]
MSAPDRSVVPVQPEARTGPALRFKLGRAWGCCGGHPPAAAQPPPAETTTPNAPGQSERALPEASPGIGTPQSALIALVVAALSLLAPSAARAYNPPAGYQKTGQTFFGSAVAFAPDGKVAVGTDNYGAGGAQVAVYSSLAAIGGSPAYTITAPSFKAIAGIEFNGAGEVVFAENFGAPGVYKATLAAPGAVAPQALAAVPGVADVTINAGVVYATVSGGAGLNKLVRVEPNQTTTVVVNNFGTGYAGGVVTDAAGNFLVTDTGPTNVSGAATGAGLIRVYSSAFAALAPVSLTGGGGTGAFDVALDSEGHAIVSTGGSLTHVDFAGGTPTVTNFGTFDPGSFPFPTSLAYYGTRFEPFDGNGVLVVSGFTDEPGIFVVQTPEPGSAVALLAVTGVVLTRRSRRKEAR